MTSARNQPFCKKFDLSIGCFDGTRINPRNITQRNISLFIYDIHFSVIWKSNGISFNEAIEKLKLNFKLVDKFMSVKHVKSFVIYENIPKKVQSPLTNIVVYDLETKNKKRAVPYCSFICHGHLMGRSFVSSDRGRGPLQDEDPSRSRPQSFPGLYLMHSGRAPEWPCSSGFIGKSSRRADAPSMRFSLLLNSFDNLFVTLPSISSET